uniref:Uncharacterized protein n=1 Tax=Percolomonas cosmopolitus TaxID=63605 RepID=A0A7S1KTV7_9EUKA|mmetsp:Transcript_9397/g.34866  ORF Transcript_9397/g.34866 Transcript_9397/m.34866 type:complete len:1069 (+) Transcript_9397:223-3429(+)
MNRPTSAFARREKSSISSRFMQMHAVMPNDAHDDTTTNIDVLYQHSEPRSAPVSRPGTAKSRRKRAETARREGSYTSRSHRKAWGNGTGSSRVNTGRQSTSSINDAPQSSRSTHKPDWNNRFFVSEDEDAEMMRDAMSGMLLVSGIGDATQSGKKYHQQRPKSGHQTLAHAEYAMNSALYPAKLAAYAAEGLNAPIQTHPLLGSSRHSSRPPSAAASRPISAKRKSTRKVSASKTKISSSGKKKKSKRSSSKISMTNAKKKNSQKHVSSAADPSPPFPDSASTDLQSNSGNNLFLDLSSHNLQPNARDPFNLLSSRSSLFKSVISARSARDTSHNISKSYEESKKRIMRLWEETNVRYTERQDFEANYFQKHPTHENMEIVFAYEQDLLYFKEMTLRILRLIEMREEHVKALHRYVKADQDGNLHGYSQLSDQLKLIISKIRFATLDIVENVVEWRSIMTYPKPFFFDKQNYLLKVQNDLNFFVTSPLASYASDLHQPFNEYTSTAPQMGLEGLSPPKLKRYQRQYLMNTLPSLNQANERSEEWRAFRDRVYRAFYVLTEEANRVDEQLSLHDSSVHGGSRSPYSSTLNSPRRVSLSGGGSNEAGDLSSRRSSLSRSSLGFHLQLKSVGMKDDLCQITFVSHFQSNEKNDYSTLLEPITARTSRSLRLQTQRRIHEEQREKQGELISMHKAATKVQSVFKGWLTRNTLKNEMRFSGQYVKRPLDSETTKLMQEALRSNTINEDDFEKMDLLVHVQCSVRTCSVSQRTVYMLGIVKWASVYLQSTVRKWHAVNYSTTLRHERKMQRIVMIQSRIRMIREKRSFVREYSRVEEYSLLFQRAYRTREACKRILWELEQKISASVVIQRVIKHWLARRSFKDALEKHRAVTIINSAARMIFARERVEHVRLFQDVTLVQRGIRTFMAKQHVHDLAERVREECIILVQSHVRELLAYIEFQRMIEEAMLEADALLNDPFFSSLQNDDPSRQLRYDPITACSIVQRAYRCYRARQVVHELLLTREKEIRETIEAENVLNRIRRIGKGGVPLHIQMIHFDRTVYFGGKQESKSLK